MQACRKMPAKTVMHLKNTNQTILVNLQIHGMIKSVYKSGSELCCITFELKKKSKKKNKKCKWFHKISSYSGKTTGKLRIKQLSNIITEL